MAGFLVHGGGEPDDGPADRAFGRKGLRCDRAVPFAGGTLRLYARADGGGCGHRRDADGDWAAYVGTLLFRGREGVAALDAILASGLPLEALEAELMGNFVLFLQRDGRLLLAQDRGAALRVYRNAGGDRLSNALLALTAGESPRAPSAQALYEYVFYGLSFGEETPLAGVVTLDDARSWDLIARAPGPRRAQPFAPLAAAPMAEQLASVESDLLDTFGTLASAFDGSVTAALSGGYDSRLMLAILRKLGVAPRLYVYGRPEDADVRVARRIAEGEGLALEVVDKREAAPLSVDAWLGVLRRNFHFFDALSADGIFDNGSDHATRAERAAKARLQLNGAGGEIFRDFWNLPDRRFAIRPFLETRYDPGDTSALSDRFDRGEFLARFAAKVQSLLGIERGWITRREMERLYPLLRNRWAGANIMLNNQLGASLLPFAEPRFVERSLGLPLRFKRYGRFQAALIASLDPALARYPSSYGYSFGEPVSWKRRLRAQARRQLPLALRRLRRRGQTARPALPYYLRGEYREAVFGRRELAIREFLDPAAITDPLRLARAFSVELLIGGHREAVGLD